MHFTDLFIKRPVLASVVSLMILLIGSWAGFKLPIRQYPELSNTTITVLTTYPGANADLIQGFITVPIQQAVASAEGIDTVINVAIVEAGAGSPTSSRSARGIAAGPCIATRRFVSRSTLRATIGRRWFRAK